MQSRSYSPPRHLLTPRVLAQQLLRHESIATTQGYLHPAREDLAKALASLQKERLT